MKLPNCNAAELSRTDERRFAGVAPPLYAFAILRRFWESPVPRETRGSQIRSRLGSVEIAPSDPAFAQPRRLLLLLQDVSAQERSYLRAITLRN